MKINKKYLEKIIEEEIIKILNEQRSESLNVPGKMWKVHPVLKAALKTVLKNKSSAGLEEFDGESSVVDFLNNDKRSASALARILVGPYCDSVEQCTKLFKDEGNPLKDGSWLESFAGMYGSYKWQMGGGGL